MSQEGLTEPAPLFDAAPGYSPHGGLRCARALHVLPLHGCSRARAAPWQHEPAGAARAAHRERHGRAAGLQRVLLGAGQRVGLVRDVEPGHGGREAGQAAVVRAHDCGRVRLVGAEPVRVLLRDLVVDVDQRRVRRELRVRVVPADAPARARRACYQQGNDRARVWLT
jgi:hypothetical protein